MPSVPGGREKKSLGAVPKHLPNEKDGKGGGWFGRKTGYTPVSTQQNLLAVNPASVFLDFALLLLKRPDSREGGGESLEREVVM